MKLGYTIYVIDAKLYSQSLGFLGLFRGLVGGGGGS